MQFHTITPLLVYLFPPNILSVSVSHEGFICLPVSNRFRTGMEHSLVSSSAIALAVWKRTKVRLFFLHSSLLL